MASDKMAPSGGSTGKDLGVKIEAKFTVGEYNVLAFAARFASTSAGGATKTRSALRTSSASQTRSRSLSTPG